MASVIAARPLVAEWTTTIVSSLPGLARLLVSDAAPEVDDLLAAMIRTARAAQFPAPGEVVGKRLAHGLKTTADVTFQFV